MANIWSTKEFADAGSWDRIIHLASEKPILLRVLQEMV